MGSCLDGSESNEFFENLEIDVVVRCGWAVTVREICGEKIGKAILFRLLR